MYYVGGFAFTTAALSNPNLVNNYAFNFWTLAMGVSGNYLVELVIGLGWILFTIAVLAFGIITISRYLLAQAFDRFLPDRLAYVSPRYGSPVVAHVIDLVITIVLIGLASFLYGELSSLYGVLVAAMIYFAFVGLAAIIYSLEAVAKGELGEEGTGDCRLSPDSRLLVPDLRIHRIWKRMGSKSARLRVRCSLVCGRSCNLLYF